jgi:S-adenosylmethionine-diacylglycerol 3-amino-3-carboxypropyl transferase
MITSAGCNALDYLIDGPAEIHAIDVNPRQNALLELKLAILRETDHATLFAMFGEGGHADHEAIYGSVRPTLPAFARRYWDRRIGYFSPQGPRGSFYYRGGCGMAAWVLCHAIFRTRPSMRAKVMRFIDAPDLATQREAFAAIEPAIWNVAARWLVKQAALMALLGVPRPQIRLIQESHPGGLLGYVQDKLRHIATELPIGENYFWRVYVAGRYSPDCCPNYLRPEHFDALASRTDRVRTHTTTVTGFLHANPGRYSHFILLDHQDWLAAHDLHALREEWEAILANAAPNAKILLRSAGLDLSFIPQDILDRLRFDRDRCAALHPTDRVGTYGSLHFAEVR